MRRLRTLRRLVPFLIGLFMVAQLGGVVSFEDAHAHPAVAASAEPHPADHPTSTGILVNIITAMTGWATRSITVWGVLAWRDIAVPSMRSSSASLHLC